MTELLARARNAHRRHGTAGLAQRAARRLAPPPPVQAEQVWYRLDLGAPDRPRRELDGGIVARRAGIADLPLLRQLPVDPSISELDEAEVRERLDGGAALWLATEGERTAFACWTFAGHAPVFLARDGGAALPAGTVLLEDSISSPDFRGRGVAPGVWTYMADELHAGGTHAMATKVGVDNASSRRAVEKAGFVEVGRMRVRRHGYRTRIDVDVTSGHAEDRWLEALRRTR